MCLGYWLKQFPLLAHGIILALTDPFQAPSIPESQMKNARTVSVLCIIHRKDMNSITQNLDEAVEGAGIIHYFGANTTL